MAFALDHLIWVSLATIALTLLLIAGVVLLFRKLFPGAKSATPIASAIVSVIVSVLPGLLLNSLFELRRDRDARHWSQQQQHLDQLRPVFKVEADKLEALATAFHMHGFMMDDQGVPTLDRTRILRLTEPDPMSPDLDNHFHDYASAKHMLQDKIIQHNKHYVDAISLTERESGFTDISWFTKQNLAITFIQQCTGTNAGFTLQVNPGGYSFSHYGGGRGGGGVPTPDLLKAYKTYKAFKPSNELSQLCQTLAKSKDDIEGTARNLSRDALLLTQHTTLPGTCPYVGRD